MFHHFISPVLLHKLILVSSSELSSVPNTALVPTLNLSDTQIKDDRYLTLNFVNSNPGRYYSRQEGRHGLREEAQCHLKTSRIQQEEKQRLGCLESCII